MRMEVRRVVGETSGAWQKRGPCEAPVVSTLESLSLLLTNTLVTLLNIDVDTSHYCNQWNCGAVRRLPRAVQHNFHVIHRYTRGGTSSDPMLADVAIVDEIVRHLIFLVEMEETNGPRGRMSSVTSIRPAS